MVLKPLDVLVVLKLGLPGATDMSYQQLGADLGLASSAAHGAVSRARRAGLLSTLPGSRAPVTGALLEFLLHGVKYCFIPDRGGVSRGIPTAYAAPVLSADIDAGDEPPPVWPYSGGTVRGISLEPLYRSAPDAALRDRALYDRLALVDAIRVGRARERRIAGERLEELLRNG